MRFRVPSPPLRTRLLQLLFPPVGMTLTLGSVSPRTILPNLTNSSSDVRRRRSRSFCNLDFSGFKSNGHRRSPGRGGILTVPYGADSGRQRKRCTNRCTKPFRPCPISPTVADYCRRIRLIPLSPASELPTVTAEVASSSLVVPAIHSKTLNLFQGIGFMGAKRCNSDSALSVRRRKSLKAQRLALPAWRA